MTRIRRQSSAPRWMVALIAAALSLGFPASAFAHNAVEDRDPAADSLVTTSPVTVSISTNDNFLDTGDATRGFAIVARDAAGLYYGDGCVSIIEATMSATVELGEGGTYSVLYQFVSADGHTLQDSYTVVFEPPPDHVPAAGLSTAPVCGDTTEELPREQATPEVIAPSQTLPLVADGSVSLIPIVAGVIVLIIVLIGLGVSGLRKRQAKS